MSKVAAAAKVGRGQPVINYQACERCWSYMGKMALIIRNFLNSAARNTYVICKGGMVVAERLKNITLVMKLLTIVGLFFAIYDFRDASRSLGKNLYFRDGEGIFLSSLSWTIIGSDVLDSITTFVNTLLALTSNPTIGVFSAIGLPAGFVMAGLGTVSRTVQIGKTYLVHRKLAQQAVTEQKTFSRFLESAIGLNGELKALLALFPQELTEQHRRRIEILKDRGSRALLRVAPKAAAMELEKLYILSKSASLEKNQVEQSLRFVQRHLRKKIELDLLAIGANLFALRGLSLFAQGVASSVPFALFMAAFSVRLAAVVYQDRHKIKKQ